MAEIGELPSMGRLRELFVYDPDTGFLVRRIGKKGARAGAIVGTRNSDGHLICRVDYRIFYVHRIAWKMHFGADPPENLDHVNGDGADNRICNIRLANTKQNGSNRRLGKNNKTGVKGVSYSKAEKKWKVGLKNCGKSIHLGYFSEIDDAAQAYRVGSTEYYGDYARQSTIESP